MATTPASTQELLARAQALAGHEIGTLAHSAGVAPPPDLRRAKGWIGELIETLLGADASSRPTPDFEHLGIELKTIPVNATGRPQESTFVCTIPLSRIESSWERSLVYRKLRQVLWVPIESNAQQALSRRVGTAVLWQPGPAEDDILRQDWEELTDLIALGNFAALDARLGQYLQIRPKAADAKALAPASDAEGRPSHSLPRGFYLRTRFTATILREAFNAAT